MCERVSFARRTYRRQIQGTRFGRARQPSVRRRNACPRLKARLDHALKISREREIDMIIATGATGYSGVNEAVAMANYLGARSDVKIVQDPNGANTRLSAQNIAKMVDQNVPLQVVSQYFHVPRTRMACLQEGFVSVQGGAPNYHEIRDIYSVPRDLVGLIAYALRLR